MPQCLHSGVPAAASPPPTRYHLCLQLLLTFLLTASMASSANALKCGSLSMSYGPACLQLVLLLPLAATCAHRFFHLPTPCFTRAQLTNVLAVSSPPLIRCPWWSVMCVSTWMAGAARSCRWGIGIVLGSKSSRVFAAENGGLTSGDRSCRR